MSWAGSALSGDTGSAGTFLNAQLAWCLLRTRGHTGRFGLVLLRLELSDLQHAAREHPQHDGRSTPEHVARPGQFSRSRCTVHTMQ
eukprot:COSAG01_NODE_9520_length_2421_cov_17.671404_4_plen_86_part_01